MLSGQNYIMFIDKIPLQNPKCLLYDQLHLKGLIKTTSENLRKKAKNLMVDEDRTHNYIQLWYKWNMLVNISSVPFIFPESFWSRGVSYWSIMQMSVMRKKKKNTGISLLNPDSWHHWRAQIHLSTSWQRVIKTEFAETLTPSLFFEWRFAINSLQRLCRKHINKRNCNRGTYSKCKCRKGHLGSCSLID